MRDADEYARGWWVREPEFPALPGSQPQRGPVLKAHVGDIRENSNWPWDAPNVNTTLSWMKGRPERPPLCWLPSSMAVVNPPATPPAWDYREEQHLKKVSRAGLRGNQRR